MNRILLLVFLIGMLPVSGLSQEMPTYEELVGRIELLRTRLEVLTSDVHNFKANVADATTTLKSDMTTVDSGLSDDISQVAMIAVPVGGVIAWWGEIDSIPENFELCDGNPPTTAGAVLSGTKPDLVDRFIRGTDSEPGATGGQDFIEDATTSPHALTLDEIPSHNHANGDWKYLLRKSGAHTIKYADNSGGEPDVKYVADILPQGGDQPHSHGISGIDNRPAFCELFYIIRVK